MCMGPVMKPWPELLTAFWSYYCYMNKPSSETLLQIINIAAVIWCNHHSDENRQSHLTNNADKVAQNVLKFALGPWLQNSTMHHYISLTQGQYYGNTSHTSATHLSQF